jgi:DNA-directed RNA polymerase subunit H
LKLKIFYHYTIRCIYSRASVDTKMELYRPGLVYSNVRCMFKNRGALPADNELSESELIQKMNHQEYIMTSAVRDASDPRGEATIIAVIIDESSRIAKATAHLQKILAVAMKQKKPNIPLEILLITHEPMQDRLMKKDDIVPEGVTISNHPYTIFLLDITKHVSSPKHELVDEKEISAFCARYHTSKEYFSKIPLSDPQSIWLGLRPGMVVRIIRVSETAGEAPTYRICIRG